MTTGSKLKLDTYTTIMLRAAQQMGCMLQVMPDREHLLKGYCPFHESSQIENTLTLLIDTSQGYFTCYNCKTRGNAKTFIARVWMIALTDVTALAQQHPDAGLDRPPYPQEYLVPVTKKTRYSQRQNTAVLTLAAAHYRENLQNNYEAIRFMVNTGIELRTARQIGLGFSNGQGLREYLKERQISEEEIQASPLFDPNSGREIMADRLTLAELDDAGGVSWMTSFTPPGNKPWERQRPSTVPLPGRRPRLMNMRVLGRRQKAVAITDDPRLYIALCAQHVPASLITRRSPTTDQLADYADSLATLLERKKARQITVMLQDNTAGARLHDRLRESRPKIRTRTALREEMDRLLNDGTADQETLFIARRGDPPAEKEEENQADGPPKDNNTDGHRRFRPPTQKGKAVDRRKNRTAGC